MAGDMMRLTDREQGRLAELCRKLAGPLGPVQVSHMAHLALGLGLDAMGKNVGLGADVGAPEPEKYTYTMEMAQRAAARKAKHVTSPVTPPVTECDGAPDEGSRG